MRTYLISPYICHTFAILLPYFCHTFAIHFARIYNMTPWTEKYRPSCLDELELNTTMRSHLKSFTLDTLPHMIISGAPGTGKTSTALILARHLLQSKESYVELNASDNRGINMVSELTNHFVRNKTVDSHKIIILDEADNITKKAQQQLINLIENYPNVRFIMTCNEMNNLVENLQSRCLLLSYDRLDTLTLKNKLFDILKRESSVSVDEDAIELLIELSDHDIRTCLNYLQVLCVQHERITASTIETSFRVPSLKTINIWLNPKKTFEQIVDNYYELQEEGYSNDDIVQMLQYYFNRLIQENSVEYRHSLMEIVSIIYDTQFKMVETSDNELLMIDMLSSITEKIGSASFHMNTSYESVY